MVEARAIAGTMGSSGEWTPPSAIASPAYLEQDWLRVSAQAAETKPTGRKGCAPSMRTGPSSHRRASAFLREGPRSFEVFPGKRLAPGMGMRLQDIMTSPVETVQLNES